MSEMGAGLMQAFNAINSYFYGGELKSRVAAEWEDDEECFNGKFAKRYLDI